MFFESSSELSTAVELERNGSPSDSRREVALAAVELAAAASLAAFSFPRFPYLFLRYRAQELSAAPSFSPVPPAAEKTPRTRSNPRENIFMFLIETRFDGRRSVP